ncbi:NHL repeat-containing protein [Pollutibacter soli]|uniref:NHL repeat-containing protein n=1 Tax=Pollutibacter soli TaxID=3034157 RepID=UPI0030133E32
MKHHLIPSFFSLLLFISCSKSSAPDSTSTPSDSVVTVAGAGRGYLNGNTVEAAFNYPTGVAIDKAGNIYVTDQANHRVRKISVQGQVTTLAGNNYQTFADGQGEDASFNNPQGITIDANGNLFVADKSNHRIRKITPDGIVSTVAGWDAGYADGSLTESRFSGPTGIAVAANGDLIVSEYNNNRIRRISLATNTVNTIAGNGAADFKNGTALSASFNKPDGIAIDKSGNIYVSDDYNHLIRKISADGIVSTIAGQPKSIGTLDGAASSAFLCGPRGLIIDENDNLFFSDFGNNKIRKITTSGVVSTFAGTGKTQASGFGSFLDGPVEKAEFSWPTGLAFDNEGNIIVADQANCKIRKIVVH